MYRLFILLILPASLLTSTLITNACATNDQKKEQTFRTAEAVKDSKIKNFYRLDVTLYRSGQPEKEGFKELEKMGIKSVLNLREYHSDTSEAKGTSIQLFRTKIAAGSLTYSELLHCMQIIESAPKPLLIHCWHGSDRTGALCAAYRIVKQGWTVEEAVNELVHGPYGHHESIYENIPTLLQSIDWEQFKKELNPSLIKTK